MPAEGAALLVSAGAGVGIGGAEEDEEEEEEGSAVRTVEGLLPPSCCASVCFVLGLCTIFCTPLSLPFPPSLAPPLVFPFIICARLLRDSLPSSHM